METQPLTKKDLTEAMEEFAAIVNTGFEGQAKLFDAKLNDLRTELKDDINSVRTELKDDINSVRTEVLESNEHIATEIQTMRAEQAAATGGRQRIDDTLLEHSDTLSNHSRRISVLEGKPAGA